MGRQRKEKGLAVERVSSGIAGLDDVLAGGFPKHRMHLIEGEPGVGKTTLALQFLLDGVAKGEPVLYVALSETAEEIWQVARSHGWDLMEGVTIQEVVPDESSLRLEEQYTIFHPSEVELEQTVQAMLREVEAIKPTRVAIDSLTELRLLAGDPLRSRHYMLALKRFFAGRRSTVLVLDNIGEQDSGLASIAHSVIVLEALTKEYGGARRRLRVAKVRGSRFRSGYHDFDIKTGGIVVYPRLVAAEHAGAITPSMLPSGVEGLDRLLGGGLDLGSSTLIVGPAGSGKSSLATQYALAAAERGERSVFYIFDERTSTLLARAQGLGMKVQPHVAADRIRLVQLDPSQVSPGEFMQSVRTSVEEEGVRVVVVDSLNGYLTAMAEEQAVLAQLHELLTYLGNQGVLTILTVAQHGLVGEALQAPLEASYLADTVIVLRYFEAAGMVRQAISVMKKRSGRHERSLREFRMGPGLQVGEPLQEFQGVLLGVPTYVGGKGTLLGNGDS